MLTMGAHSCQPSTLLLSYPAVPGIVCIYMERNKAMEDILSRSKKLNWWFRTP